MERKGHFIMARISKIARLNPEIRTRLNSRLADGADGRAVLHWLNSLPPIRETLARFFGARLKNRDHSCLVKVFRACPCNSCKVIRVCFQNGQGAIRPQTLGKRRSGSTLSPRLRGETRREGFNLSNVILKTRLGDFTGSTPNQEPWH